MEGELIIMKPDALAHLLATELEKATVPLRKAIEALENRDELIYLDEAMRIMKINAKSAFYKWVSEGWINNYGEGSKPLFSRKECTTARQRKKQQLQKIN